MAQCIFRLKLQLDGTCFFCNGRHLVFYSQVLKLFVSGMLTKNSTLGSKILFDLETTNIYLLFELFADAKNVHSKFK